MTKKKIIEDLSNAIDSIRSELKIAEKMAKTTVRKPYYLGQIYALRFSISEIESVLFKLRFNIKGS